MRSYGHIVVHGHSSLPRPRDAVCALTTIMTSKARLQRWKRNGRTLGQGGQAQVLIVTDNSGLRSGEHALKVLTNVQRTPRLDLEINTTKSLFQSGAPVLEVVDDYLVSEPDAAHPWYVSPIADGGDLGTSLERAPLLKAKLTDALALFREIEAAVAILHKNGVAHRDLKPANILISNGKYILCDLGLCLPLAIDLGTDRLTATLERIGSLNYTPPEAFGRQVLGQNHMAFDAYALGKILYELIAGRALPGFLGPDDPGYDLTRQFPEPVFAGVNMLLRELLHIEPTRRLQSLQTLAERTVGLTEWAASNTAQNGEGEWRDKMAVAGNTLAQFTVAATKTVDALDAKAECDAVGRQLMATLQASGPLAAVGGQLVAAHPDALDFAIVEGAQLRNALSGAFVKTREALEPIEDKGYPVRPSAESGCCATFQSKGGAPLLSTLVLGALVGIKHDRIVVAVGVAERSTGLDQPIDFIGKTTQVISSTRGDPQLLQKAIELIQTSATSFAGIVLERISNLRI